MAQNIEEQHLKMTIEDILNESSDSESNTLVNMGSDDHNYSPANEKNTGEHRLLAIAYKCS
jgi:elongation factor P hydroxylase